MSEPWKGNFETRDASPAQQVRRIRAQFEVVWRQALQGAPRPKIELFLGSLPEPERSQLRRDLERIEREYEQKLLARSAETLGPSAPTDGTVCQTIADQPAGDSREHALQTLDQTMDTQSATSPRLMPTIADVDSKQGAFSIGAPSTAPTEGELPKVPGYLLIDELGRGGMGVVYKARQLGLNRLVALKMVLAGAHAGPDQLARFHTEAEAVAHLQHPNIVQIYEVNSHDGLPYFSLEFVDGGSLASKIDGKPQPQREAAEILEQLARAMACAHERGIVHRDLKPANVLIGAGGVPKITDFGLAKRLEADSKQTRSGTLMGTPSYMSPEQAKGDTHDIGPLADQYSLGAILYEMLTGRPPFQGTTLLETLEQVRTQEPVPPTRLQPRISRDLETICLKCLQKEKHQRYPTTEALADDLRRFLHGEPIQARPVSAPERAIRWCKRNPRVAAMSAAIVVLAVSLGVTGVLTLARRAREQRVVEQAGLLAAERLDRVRETIRRGDYRRALDLLSAPDPMLQRSAALGGVRRAWEAIDAQVHFYTEFRQGLENARFLALISSGGDLPAARDACRRLIGLHESLEHKTGSGRFGLPPLDRERADLFRQDLWELYLIAAQVEWDLAHRSQDPGRLRQGIRDAIELISRADRVIPGTKTVPARRSGYWKGLGDRRSSEADVRLADSIEARFIGDRFFHADADLRRGEEARRRRDPEKARAEFRKAIAGFASVLQLRPEHFWAYFEWANCQYSLGNLDDARIGYTACIEIEPDIAWTYLNRGIVNREQGAYDEAVQDLEQALARDPHRADAHLNLALVYMARKDRSRAEAAFARALAENPDSAEVYFNRAAFRLEQKDLKGALADYTRALARNAALIPAYRQRARVYLDLGKPAEAIRDLDAAIAGDPDGETLLVRAQIQRAVGKLDMALKDLDRALGGRPAPEEGYALRAAIYAQQRRWNDAIRDYTAALERRPHSGSLLRERARAYLALNKPDAALGDLDRAVGESPDDAESYPLRASLLLQQRRWKEAIRDYTVALKYQPHVSRFSLSRAQAHLALNQLEAASADLDRAIADDPNSAEAYPLRAKIAFLRGDYRRAREDFSSALRLRPEAAGLYRDRAVIELLGLKDFDAALADWKAVARLKPDEPEAHYYVGAIEMGRRNYDAALRAFQLAIDSQADFALAYLARAQIRHWQGKLDRALEDDTFVVETLAPKNAYFLNDRPDVYRTMGKYDLAAADCRKSIALDPKQTDPYIVLAWIQQRQGEDDEASATYDAMVKADPGSSAVYLRRAEFRRSVQEYAAALADCDLAQQRDRSSVLPGLVRASILAAQGDPTRAVNEAEHLLKKAKPGDGHVLYAAACVFSLASRAAAARPDADGLARAYADRAADLLAEALDKGFHDLNYQEQNRMPYDPALQPVLGHLRVRKLLAHEP